MEKHYRLLDSNDLNLGASCSLASAKIRAKRLYLKHGAIRIYYKNLFIGAVVNGGWVRSQRQGLRGR